MIQIKPQAMRQGGQRPMGIAGKAEKRTSMTAVSRRNFIAGSAGLAGVAAMAGIAGAALAEQAAAPAEDGGHGTAEQPGKSGFSSSTTDDMRTAPTDTSWLTAPEPISDDEISETVDADVVVVGCGVAGLCAARAAAEAGAKVVVIEKAESYQYRSGQYGVYNSQIQQENGMDFDPRGAINAMMKEMGYRPDERIWNEWAEYSGPAFDWLLSASTKPVDFIDNTATSYNPDDITIQGTHFPVPEDFDASKEFSPTYPQATCTFVPDQGGILEENYQAALAAGAEFRFSCWARQLTRDGVANGTTGRADGVIAQTVDGTYFKVTAAKGVIMCAGDYGSNSNMVKYYCGGRTYPAVWMNMDAAGNPTNVGEGQQMGMWIGAKMEDGPHAPMTHTLGGALGCDAFFLANTRGQRFVNEDVAGQQLSTQLYRQPGEYGIQIFDDNYADQVGKMNCAHGSVNHIVEDDPTLDGYGMTIGKYAVATREMVEQSCDAIADTIEELADKLGLDETAKANLVASVERYNELCEAGVDSDFGKTAERMFPITQPPFYATKISAGGMLVCLGGLSMDPETLNVVDYDYQPIEGLFAAGNNMGGRILQDYPVAIGGVSHATAMTFGWLAGTIAATGEFPAEKTEIK